MTRRIEIYQDARGVHRRRVRSTAAPGMAETVVSDDLAEQPLPASAPGAQEG